MMFDNMMKYKSYVIGHPRMKDKLHGMRIIGKPARYIMEIMEPTFGREFSKCLQEIKNILEIMGDIHDTDVFIIELEEYLVELISYNRIKQKSEKRFNTSVIKNLIIELKEKRNKNYILLCETLNKWDNENFRDKLINSMKFDRINNINFFNVSNHI